MSKPGDSQTPEQRAERRRVGEAMAASATAANVRDPFNVVLAALDIAVIAAEDIGWDPRNLLAALLVSNCNNSPDEAIGEIRRIIESRRSKLS